MVEMQVGKIVLEFGEMTGFTKKDYNKVKQWLTQSSDEIQRKYQNETITFPRQFVKAGTTNDDKYFTDPSGNRRFWPVKVAKHIDIEALKTDVTQLWAEAVYRAKAGERHYMTDDDPAYKEMQHEQSERMLGDVWEESILSFVQNRAHVKVDEILTECVRIPKDRWDNRHRSRITGILRSHGWENKVIRIASRTERVYVPPNDPDPDQETLEF